MSNSIINKYTRDITCSNEFVSLGSLKCQPNPFKPTDKQIKRYQAEYNYINQFKLQVESVSEYLQSKAYIKL